MAVCAWYKVGDNRDLGDRKIPRGYLLLFLKYFLATLIIVPSLKEALKY